MDAKGKAILEKRQKERDFVPRSREILAEWDSEYLEYYHSIFTHVRNESKGLSTKIKGSLFIAIDAAQLYEAGLAAHMRSAFKEGATPLEVLDSLMAASICSGIHALSVSLPYSLTYWRSGSSKSEGRGDADEQDHHYRIG